MTTPKLEAPKFVELGAMTIAGIAQHYEGDEAAAGIPKQWQRFALHLGNISQDNTPRVTYGVCTNTTATGGMDYLAGIEVKDVVRLPAEFTQLQLAPRRYAVFQHRDNVATIRDTWKSIWSEGMATFKKDVGDAPFFERYTTAFDPKTGNGGVELWVPLQPLSAN